MNLWCILWAWDASGSGVSGVLETVQWTVSAANGRSPFGKMISLSDRGVENA
ncbi:hypothetical protein C7964_101861 [Loktanella sp. PT4BL]|nr:hypothetical protein C7964_101861 [Loktanella sp. PT4BL]